MRASQCDQFRSAHHDVLVGDIGAYPDYPAADLEEWILTLEAAGAKPAFFHLDVDLERVEVSVSETSRRTWTATSDATRRARKDLNPQPPDP